MKYRIGKPKKKINETQNLFCDKINEIVKLLSKSVSKRGDTSDQYQE